MNKKETEKRKRRIIKYRQISTSDHVYPPADAMCIRAQHMCTDHIYTYMFFTIGYSLPAN